MTRAVLVSCLLASTAALADELSPAQEEAKAKFDDLIARPLKVMNEKCETSLSITANWEKLNVARFGERFSYAGSCEMALLDSLRALCGRPAYKKAVTAKIKALHCNIEGTRKAADGSTTATAEATRAAFSLKNGVLSYEVFKEQNILDNGEKAISKLLN